MPVTLTVSGHEELITSLKNLSNKLQGPEVVNALAHESAIELGQTTPVGVRGSLAGQLRRTMTEVGGPNQTGGGWWAGVGNLEGIYPLKSAPPHTIKRFLELIGKSKPSRVKTTRLGGFRPKRTRSGSWKMAWWFLSDKEKEQLREMREAGVAAVGGTSPYKPKYWFIQEAGMGTVGIRPQGYVAQAVNRIRNRIDDTVVRIIRSI